MGGLVLILIGALIGLTLGKIGNACAQEIPAAAHRYRADLTRNARAVWGIDAPTSTFAGQVHQESLWRPDAVSAAGAQGIAQFMPGTSAWIGKAYPELAVRAPMNPAWGLRAMVIYDRHLWERLDDAAAPCERMAMTLASYNGGLGWVRRDQRLAAAQGADRSRWFGEVERFNAGRNAAAFRENRGYPRLILRHHEPIYVAAGWGLGSCLSEDRGQKTEDRRQITLTGARASRPQETQEAGGTPALH